MSTLIENLIEAGLEPSTANIYVFLAENGEQSVPKIIEKTALSRTAIYESLNLLIIKNYVEYRKDGRKALYRVSHPQKLFDLMSEKKRQTALLEDKMQNTVKTLVGAYNLTQNKPGVRFFDGKDGLREVIFDSLTAKNTIYTYMDSEAINKYIKDINEEYIQKRKGNKIPKKIIAIDTPFARERYKQLAGDLTEVRLIPFQANPFKTGMQIYDNTVSYTTLDEKKMIGVIIKDEDIASMHKSLFEFTWSKLPAMPR